MSTPAGPGTLHRPTQPGTRAVLRIVEPGTEADCAACGEPVKFAARRTQHRVIANVYCAGRWDRVEHFHAECYNAAGSPYGEPDASAPNPRRRARAAA
jgi:hypothetical protein